MAYYGAYMSEKNFVRSVREKAKLSRAELAAYIGVSKRTVEGWETKRHPSKTARKLLEGIVT